MSSEVGRVVAERYRLVGLIGSGPWTSVYVAEDLESGDQVAFKVFDRQLVDNAAFLERLAEAAELAASLDHPNIARLLDWGVDFAPYVVTELCEGGSLRGMLDEGHHLTPSQALVVSLEAARALEYAHERGVEHRNIRPSNLLFSQDQRLRFTDLGFARIFGDAPAATPEDALRSVRYASPEQARGRPVNESSDMYSLALTINEAVTGEPPAVAETVVGTLMARAEAPVALGPVLGELRGVIERCGRVDPLERPEAGELVIALLATAETMARPSGLPLVGLASAGSEPEVDESPAADPSVEQEGSTELSDTELSDTELSDTELGDAELGDAGVGADAVGGAEIHYLGDPPAADATTDTPTAAPRDTDTDAATDADAATDTSTDSPADSPADADIELGGPSPAEPIVPEPIAPELEALPDAEPIFATIPSDVDEGDAAPALDVPEPQGATLAAREAARAYEQEDDDLEDRLPWWPLALLVVLIGAAVGVGVFAYVRLDAGRTHQVPNLIGLPFDELDSVIGDYDWNVERREDRLDGSTAGTIIRQVPDVGARLDEGDTIKVTVSLGNAMVEIPSDLDGLTVEQAATRLVSVGLELGSTSEVNNESLAAGLVIGIDEPTTQKPRGEPVSLRVSLGPQARVVPESVIGMNVEEAIGVLAGLRLIPIEEPVFDPAAAEGTVLGVDPASGETVEADSGVTLFVSAGPEPVEVPDITGLSLEDSIDLIESVGLVFVNTEGTPGEPAIGTDPPIGEVVDVGTEVLIILDEPAEDEEEEGDEG